MYMAEHNDLSELSKALVELDESGVEQLIKKELNQGTVPEHIIRQLSDGLTEVGERFRREEYFLTELIYSGEIFKKAMAMIDPYCKKSAGAKSSDIVVMGTVQGDIHDLGKNIVTTLLKCSGFSVFDIGVDASPERFLDAVVQSKAKLVGMSMLLTTAYDAAKATVASIEQMGLRENVKIMIGGSVTSENVRREMGADFWGCDATSAVDIAKTVYR